MTGVTRLAMQSAAECCGLSSSDPRVATWILARDQQCQLERVFEAELRQLPRGSQSGDHVASL